MYFPHLKKKKTQNLHFSGFLGDITTVRLFGKQKSIQDNFTLITL